MKSTALLIVACLLAAPALAQRHGPPLPPLTRPAAGGAAKPAAAPDEPLTVHGTALPEAAPACKTVNGQVLDENNKPLVGASIGIVGTRELNSTNSDGYYNFALPVRDEPAPVTLRFSAAGYAEQELPVAACTLPVVTLKLLPGTRVKQGKRHYGKLVKVNGKRVK